MINIGIIFTVIVRFFSQAFIIFGGIAPYIPQYLIIKKSQNAGGFSTFVCFIVLIANILRIEFWFVKYFEIPLLLQSIVVIIRTLIMLEICIRVSSKSLHRHSSTNQEKKFTDFDMNYFWRWTTFTSYIQFLLVFTFLLSTTTWLFINNTFYVETIGFLAVFFEALLGTPQFLHNFRLKSTKGMSIKMVLMWTSGDIFKTVYFIIRNAPIQFSLCGILQINIDIAILCQVIAYPNK